MKENEMTDAEIIEELRSEGNALLAKASEAAQNTHESDLSPFCRALDAAMTELPDAPQARRNAFHEKYDYLARVL